MLHVRFDIKKVQLITLASAFNYCVKHHFLTMGFNGFSALISSKISKLSGEGLSNDDSKVKRHLEGIWTQIKLVLIINV